MGRKSGHATKKKAATGRKSDYERLREVGGARSKRQASEMSESNSEKIERRERRRAVLTHDSKEKREQAKLRLHITSTQRQVEKMRERMSAWDEVEEQAAVEAAIKKQKEEEEREKGPKKKKGRKGPETWQLRGAARPAWQVYDFDTRYVDPHIKAHEEHREKVKRIRNLLVLHKGRFGQQPKDGESTSALQTNTCREFLSLLMQFGLLNMQAKRYKTAKSTFVECMELDSPSDPITPARCHLMRLYLEANRPDSARKLWESLSPDDPSVWIRYSAALLEFVSWKLLEEDGSTKETAELHMARAIRTNIFCACYLAFSETFQQVMDYTDEIEGANEDNPLEEAIEYCNSEQMGAWQGTEGALDWIREAVVKVFRGEEFAGGEVTQSDSEWRPKIGAMRKEYELINGKDEKEPVSDDDASYDSNKPEPEPEPDFLMFAGMFETGMEMVEEQGVLR